MSTSDTKPYHSLSVIPDIDQKIIDGIIAGHTLRQLAHEHACSHVAVLKRAKQHPEYAIALEASLQVRMEDRVEELEKSADNVTVARSRELLSHARWTAERSCPDRWGQAKPGAGAVNVQIVIAKPDDASHNVVIQAVSTTQSE